MPLYDYTCQQCQKKFEIRITYADFGSQPVHCPSCGSENVQRRFKAPRVISSDSKRLVVEGESYAAASPQDDPQTLGRMMRQVQQQSGETMAPEFDEVVDRLESGESIDSIDSDFAANDSD